MWLYTGSRINITSNISVKYITSPTTNAFVGVSWRLEVVHIICILAVCVVDANYMANMKIARTLMTISRQPLDYRQRYLASDHNDWQNRNRDDPKGPSMPLRASFRFVRASMRLLRAWIRRIRASFRPITVLMRFLRALMKPLWASMRPPRALRRPLRQAVI